MRMTRRFFLQSTGAMAVYCGVNPLDRALAQTMGNPADHVVAKNKTLVVVFLRGGIDGLNWIVPYADPHYAKLRPSIQVKRPGQDEGAIDLDGFFGIHPRAHRLMPWFDQGLACAAHAVGYEGNSRSHFEEQDVWETGVAGNTLGSDGWLNRHLLTSNGHGPIRAVAISDTLPRILRGDAPAYALSGLQDLGLPTKAGDSDAIAAALEHAYQGHTDEDADHATGLVTKAGRETLDGLDVLRKVADQPYTPGAKYPDRSRLGKQFQTAAQLIKANLGLEVVQIDYGGWDTHNRQGAGAQGNFGDKVQELSDALAALAEDLGTRLQDTLVLTISDFGRTAAENGTAGTDHGHANAMLALGGPVQNLGTLAAGGTNSPTTPGRRKVLTAWPGLSPDQLNENRDLAHTLDFRDVLAEVVRVHLGNDNLPTVLPGHEFKNVGLVG
ncbi:MAG: DUF1501 domain-containing protein [Planctomycetota bacterium]